MAGFFLYKVYTRLFSKIDEPWDRTYVYISLNMVFINFSIYIIIEGLLNHLNLKIIIPSYIPNWLKYSFFFGGIPMIFSYFMFFYKKDIGYYELKYKNHWLNKFYFDIMLLILPFILFITGPILRILLFGGYMLGKDYEGYASRFF